MMPLTPKAAGVMFSRWMNNPAVAKYMPWNHLTELDSARAFVSEDIERNKTDSYYSWGMYFDDFAYGYNRPRLFGHVILIVSEERNCGVVRVVLMKSEWGKGYATEAVKTVCKFAFEKLNLDGVAAPCHSENLAAHRVLQKAGFYEAKRFDSAWKDGTKQTMVGFRINRNYYFK